MKNNNNHIPNYVIRGDCSYFPCFSYSMGQISNYLEYGYNREMRLIAESFNPEGVIWIKYFGSIELLSMYRKDMSNDPEWSWEFKNWVPKNHLLKVFPVINTYTWNIIDMKNLQNKTEYYDTDKIAIIISVLDRDYFNGEEYLMDFFDQDWLHFEKKVDLKNRGMYIFDRIDTVRRQTLWDIIPYFK